MLDRIVAFVFVQTAPGEADAARLLAEMREVEEIHRVAGEDCYVVRVRVPNVEHLGGLVRDKIERIKTVRSTRTTLVLRTFKDTQFVKDAARARRSVRHAADGGVASR